MIDNYHAIINALDKSAAKTVPRIGQGSLKYYWNEQLSELKQSSIDMHNLLKMCGRPRNGHINEARLKTKYEYKKAIKNAALSVERQNSDDINLSFLNKNSKQFWKCWNSHN